jgi:hypothetical protein
VRVLEEFQRFLVAAGPQLGDNDPGPVVFDAFVDLGEQGMGRLGRSCCPNSC